MKGYKLLDRYIKKENEKLKENNQKLQDEYDEVSTKLKKVLHLIHYRKVIKMELKEEASSVNILDPNS